MEAATMRTLRSLVRRLLVAALARIIGPARPTVRRGIVAETSEPGGLRRVRLAAAGEPAPTADGKDDRG